MGFRRTAAAARAKATPRAGLRAATRDVESGTARKLGAHLLVVLYDPRRRAPASEGDVLGMISLGCLMQSMWLVASSFGIGFQIKCALSTPPVEAEVKKPLAIPAPLKIGFACRLGYPLQEPKYLRVRRDIEDFVHHNRY